MTKSIESVVMANVYGSTAKLQGESPPKKEKAPAKALSPKGGKTNCYCDSYESLASGNAAGDRGVDLETCEGAARWRFPSKH
jgi:hypothetical protein